MTADFITVDEFLEHHGTKGMRWGVRKETSVGSGGNKPSSSKPASKSVNRSSSGTFVKQKKGLTPRQKKQLIAAGVVAGVGALFVAHYLLKNKGQNFKVAKDTVNISRGLNEAKRSLNNVGGVKLIDVRKGFAVDSKGVATPIVSTMNPFRSPAGLLGR